MYLKLGKINAAAEFGSEDEGRRNDELATDILKLGYVS